MFVEQLLEPFKCELASEDRTLEACGMVLKLLAEVEQRPLKAAEMRLIKSTVEEFLQRANVELEPQVRALLDLRLSFEYIPFVSKLGLRPGVGVVGVGGDRDSFSEEEASPRSRSGTAGTLKRPASVSLLEDTKYYYVCNVKRHQSTLWTSYRMYWYGTKEFDASGSFVKFTGKNPPVMLFGAKKFKSGISNCLVWNQPDSKLWREKAAVGRVSKVQDVYVGAPLGAAAGQLGWGVGGQGQGEEAREGSTEGPGVGMGTGPEIGTAGTGSVSGTVSGSGRSSSVAPSPVPMGLGEEAEGVGGHGNEGNEAGVGAGAGAGVGAVGVGSIALSVSSKGLDKLIHVTGLAMRLSVHSANTMHSTFPCIPSTTPYLHSTPSAALHSTSVQSTVDSSAVESSTVHSGVQTVHSTGSSSGSTGSATPPPPPTFTLTPPPPPNSHPPTASTADSEGSDTPSTSGSEGSVPESPMPVPSLPSLPSLPFSLPSPEMQTLPPVSALTPTPAPSASARIPTLTLPPTTPTLTPASTPTHAHSTPTLREDELVSMLRRVALKEPSPADNSPHLLLLRSKQPRRLPSSSRNTPHTVAFGRESRVRWPSRKNIVVESVTHAGEVVVRTDWVSESEQPPLLQIGKLEEGLFSLDYHDLTPFQAFCIAMAVFDQ